MLRLHAVDLFFFFEVFSLCLKPPLTVVCSGTSSLLITVTMAPILMGLPAMSVLLLELGCEDYSFLDQTNADFEQGLDSILTDSIETLELDTSFDEPDAITSSVYFVFLHSISTISDTSKPHPAPSMRSHNCGARPGSFFHLSLWLPRCQHLT